MKIKSKLTILTLLVAVLATSFEAVSAYANEGEMLQSPKMPMQNEHMLEMKAALENGDYEKIADEYYARTGRELSPEQFEVMGRAHELRNEGDKEGALELLDEAGIEGPNKKRFKRMRALFRKDLTDEQKEVLKKAKEMLEKAGIDFPPKGLFNAMCDS